MVQPLWRFLKKLKIELPYDPTIPLLGTYPEKNMFLKDTCIPVFAVALFTIANTWTFRLLPCLAIANSAAMSIEVHASFQIMLFSGCMPRSEIVGSYGGSIFSFFKETAYCSP